MGTFAVHCFYLGLTKIGMIRLAIGAAVWFFLFVGVLGESDLIIFLGFLFWAVASVWLVIDLFKIPSYIRKQQAIRREELAMSLFPKQNISGGQVSA